MKNFLNSIFSYTVINLFSAKILINLELGNTVHDSDNIELVETTDCHEDIQEVIVMRENPKVTLMKDRLNTFSITHFYLKPLLLNKTASIIGPITGSILAVLLKKIVPKLFLVLIEKITATHREIVERKTKIEDMRDKHLSTKFGSYVECRRSEATWTIKERDYYINFL
jgi:hypothetical protein